MVAQTAMTFRSQPSRRVDQTPGAAVSRRSGGTVVDTDPVYSTPARARSGLVAVELAERPEPERVEVAEIVPDRAVGDAVIDGQVVVYEHVA